MLLMEWWIEKKINEKTFDSSATLLTIRIPWANGMLQVQVYEFSLYQKILFVCLFVFLKESTASEYTDQQIFIVSGWPGIHW